MCIYNYSFLLCMFFIWINKPNIHNNITGISSLQNGLNDLFSSTGIYLKSKVRELVFTRRKMFFNFWAILRMCILRLWQFFLANQLNFSLAERIYKIHVFDEAFFLLIVRMPYGHQTFQGGYKLRGALTHKYI